MAQYDKENCLKVFKAFQGMLEDEKNGLTNGFKFPEIVHKIMGFVEQSDYMSEKQFDVLYQTGQRYIQYRKKREQGHKGKQGIKLGLK
jgi:hypothetical protein